MKDPNRIDGIIDELLALWKENPDWRLGQVIANVVRAQTGAAHCDPFYLRDDEMLEGIRRLSL